MKEISLRELLEAGCHFGHEVKRWNPRAAQFIYTTRDRIHIIDLVKTKEGLLAAGEFALKLGTEGKKLLFVGTKRQAKKLIHDEAVRVDAPFFSQRWVGGFITNWTEVKKRIDKLNKMDADKKTGAWQKFVKHEQLKLDRERLKLEKYYGGVKQLSDHPDALFIVDVKKESAAVSECLKAGIPIISIVDTNSDPTKINYPIPANDDAVKSITLLISYLANAYEEGLQAFKKKEVKTEVKAKEPVAVVPKLQAKTKKVKKVKDELK